MGSAQPTGKASVWHEGAGRVFVPQALAQTVWAEPASLSMGYFPYPQNSGAATQTLVYRNSGSAAVTLTLAANVKDEKGNAPAPEQFSVGASSVTVPAGGTASVPVIVNPQTGQAGLFGGAIVATGQDGRQARTTVGWYKEPVRMELTVDITNRDGQPAGGRTTVDIMNVDDKNVYFESGIPVEDGRATVRVPAGNYSVLAYVGDYQPGGVFMNRLSSVMDPEVSVTADATVTLDARKAVPITVDADQPTEPTSLAVGQIRLDAHGAGASHMFSLSAGYPIYATPTDPVTIGSFEYYTHTSLRKPPLEAETVKPTTTPIVTDYASGSDKIDGVVEAAVVDAGLGRPEDFAATDVRGKVALVQRGAITFVAKVQNALNAGAVAVIIYNNVPEPLLISVYPDTLLTMTTDLAEGERLRALTKPGPLTVRLTGTPNTPYTYDLVFAETAVPHDLAYRADSTNTVAIDTSYRAFKPNSQVGDTRHMWRPSTSTSLASLRQHVAPMARAEYVSTGDTTWSQYFFPNLAPTQPIPMNGTMMSAPVAYRKPGKLSSTWLHAVLRGGLQPALSRPEAASAYRKGDLIGINSASYVDNAGHYSIPPAQEDSFSTTLYADGKKLLDKSNSGYAEVQVPSGRTSYRLVTDARRNQPWWTLSTRQHTEWEFTSSTTGSATVLPLLDISMVPQQLDELNRATKRNTEVTLTVGHQEGSHGAAVKGVRAWWSSDDGATWKPAQMKSKQGVWTAVAKAPKGSGAISLRAEAWDAAGSRVTEEVTRAYIAGN
ncbi:PA domain-containing protein [Streptosporangium sp. NPDC003464]